METFYRRYLERCNEHRFDELGDFVDPEVEVNGAPAGLDQYAAGLRSVIEAFPDYHWDLQHLLVDGDWLSAHLIDTGTHTGGPFLDLRPAARSGPRSSPSTTSPPAKSPPPGATWTQRSAINSAERCSSRGGGRRRAWVR